MKYHQPTEDGQQLIPPIGYTSDACFQRELDLLFSRYWNFAGMADDVPNPGDYQCVQAGRYPLVIVRDNEGEIRAFHNLCRHRGMQFLEDSGNSRKGFTCPYHKWFYKLDGRLKTVPRQDSLFPDIDKSQLGLLPASVGIFRGMVFVHPDVSPAEDFEAFVADLESKVGPHRPDQMVEVSRKRVEIRANWKIVVENYLDTYHLFYLHERTTAMLDHTQFDWGTTGRHFLLYEPVDKKHKDWVYKTYGLAANGYVPGADPETYGAQYHMFFPNIGWSAMVYSWSTYHVIPIAVDKTIVENRTRVMPVAVEQMKDPRGDKDLFSISNGKLNTVEDAGMHPMESSSSLLEDMWACQQLQKGMMSPAFRVGALARKYESMLTFHQRNVLDFVSYT